MKVQQCNGAAEPQGLKRLQIVKLRRIVNSFSCCASELLPVHGPERYPESGRGGVLLDFVFLDL